ncbi:hypothetical protein CEXT_218241 [Caerostris extrusa]|uniref:Uncharacterized protein n=1 Tax=Caerostris extrusa TaxID=172846 RepID=A0AAV4TZU2_CAEEX|nr:hypothetical protein CEXT_218241 [Caerostris extrusa]
MVLLKAANLRIVKVKFESREDCPSTPIVKHTSSIWVYPDWADPKCKSPDSNVSKRGVSVRRCWICGPESIRLYQLASTG